MQQILAMQQNINTRLGLVITGFGAFPGVKINPSARLAHALGKDRCWARLGLKVEAHELAVGYTEVRETLGSIAARNPRALLMFGVAARAKNVRIETRAINRVSCTARDATRALPGTGRLDADAPAFRMARADCKGAMRAMRGAGVIARQSRNAGRYVCNAGYWWALDVMKHEARVLFVHIPMLRNHGARRGETRPDFANLLRGAKIIALRLMLAARLRA